MTLRIGTWWADQIPLQPEPLILFAAGSIACWQLTADSFPRNCPQRELPCSPMAAHIHMGVQIPQTLASTEEGPFQLWNSARGLLRSCWSCIMIQVFSCLLWVDAGSSLFPSLLNRYSWELSPTNFLHENLYLRARVNETQPTIVAFNNNGQNLVELCCWQNSWQSSNHVYSFQGRGMLGVSTH